MTETLRCAEGEKACANDCVRTDDVAFGCAATSCNQSECPSAGSATLVCEGGKCVIGSCGAGTKKCGGACVDIGDPTYGCGETTCDASACPDPGAGTLVCSGTTCNIGSCNATTKKCGNKCVPLDKNNGCAEAARCTACDANETCVGAPTKCGCVPDNTEACKGKACGTATNNCGQVVTCTNTCQLPQTCAGGNAGSNGCGCTPNDPCATKACGSATNNCGNLVACTNTCRGNTPVCSGNTCYECNVAGDCPTAGSNPCAVASCVNHKCGFVVAPANTSCPGGKCSGSAIGICVRQAVPAGSFSIDATEVTRGKYAAFLQAKQGSTSGQPATCAWNTTYVPEEDWPPSYANYDLPVAWVDWCDAYAYCAWAGQRLCGKIGGGPNSADAYADAASDQWMAACVGASSFAYPYGNAFNVAKCNGPKTSSQAAPVASYACTGGYAGLYDMSGNVWEWEDACYASTGSTDFCRERGGSYVHTNDDSGIFLRCDTNNNNTRSTTDSSIGFRCCQP